MKITLIGFGEVGQILAADLADKADIKVWDILFSDPASARTLAASNSGVTSGKNASEAVTGADIIFSAVTAAQTCAAAKEAAQTLLANALYVDLNSASPGAKTQAAAKIKAAGGRYVEASVMSPIGPKRLRSPILLGGPYAKHASDALAALGLTGTKVFSDVYGKASAAKMCRSVMIKGMEALLSESLLSARRYGVEETVLTSLNDLFPGLDWPELSRYMISRTVEHGARRAEEMREVARTIEQAGLSPHMSLGCAQRQDWAAKLKGLEHEETLTALLDKILEKEQDGDTNPR